MAYRLQLVAILKRELKTEKEHVIGELVIIGAFVEMDDDFLIAQNKGRRLNDISLGTQIELGVVVRIPKRTRGKL